MKRKIITLLLALGLAVGTATTAFAADYSGHWYSDTVEWSINHRIIEEYDNMMAGPIPRWMAWLMLMNTERPAARWEQPNDIRDAAIWVEARGISDGQRPCSTLTRAEFGTMLYRMVGMTHREEPFYFKDAFRDGASVPWWANDSLNWAIGGGLIHGDDYGYLNPNGDIKGVEALTILRRVAM